MIFIKTDDGHEKFPLWSDVEKRPHYTNKISGTEHKLSRIFGYYELKGEIHCSLSSCNQPHGKGYLVATETGLATNIGHQCGKKIFGIDFENHADDFDKFRESEERKISVRSAKSKIETWERSLNELRTGGKSIQWAIEAIEELQNAHFVGRAAAIELRSLSRTQNGNVKIDVQIKDKKYAELLFKFNKHLRDSGQALEEEVIGKIKNLHVLLTENHLKLLFTTATSNIKDIRQADENSAPSPVLLSLSQKANNLQSEVDKVISIYRDAREFLTRKNLSPVLKKLNLVSTVPQEEREAFARFLRNL